MSPEDKEGFISRFLAPCMERMDSDRSLRPHRSKLEKCMRGVIDGLNGVPIDDAFNLSIHLLYIPEHILRAAYNLFSSAVSGLSEPDRASARRATDTFFTLCRVEVGRPHFEY